MKTAPDSNFPAPEAAAGSDLDDPALVAADLLAWYDRHARDLPWRIPPGDPRRADPYRVWLSEVMLQQTTVAAVKRYFLRFTTLWPDIQSLAAANPEQIMAEWAGLGYYARARNLIACAKEVARLGRFPETMQALRQLPGIGDYTSAAIAAIAFDQPETVVDGNVERVAARLFAVKTPLPRAKKELRHLAGLLTPTQRPGDYAQAMMDLGATICTPRSPRCDDCPLRQYCAAHAAGLEASLPARLPKTAKPRREGRLWLLTNPNGDILVERRPAKGLLGGTLGFPTSDWDGRILDPPAEVDWHHIGSISHIFTHFSLDMKILTAVADTMPRRGFWLPRAEFSPEDLPSLFRKAWTRATA